MPYSIPPPHVERAMSRDGYSAEEYMAWLRDLAEKDLPNICSVMGWKHVRSFVEPDRHIPRQKMFHAIVRDSKKAEIEIKFETSQKWFRMVKAGCWNVVVDPRPDTREVRRS